MENKSNNSDVLKLTYAISELQAVLDTISKGTELLNARDTRRSPLQKTIYNNLVEKRLPYMVKTSDGEFFAWHLFDRELSLIDPYEGNLLTTITTSELKHFLDKQLVVDLADVVIFRNGVVFSKRTGNYSYLSVFDPDTFDVVNVTDVSYVGDTFEVVIFIENNGKNIMSVHKTKKKGPFDAVPTTRVKGYSSNMKLETVCFSPFQAILRDKNNNNELYDLNFDVSASGEVLNPTLVKADSRLTKTQKEFLSATTFGPKYMCGGQLFITQRKSDRVIVIFNGDKALEELSSIPLHLDLTDAVWLHKDTLWVTDGTHSYLFKTKVFV